MLAFFVLCLLGTTCFAANGYDFEMNYTGDLIKGQEKAIDMVLIGDGTSSGYSKVRIKVEISGPCNTGSCYLRPSRRIPHQTKPY